jgi:hypothetical protein
MKRTSTHRGRFYTEDGRKYPSVTTILSCISKPALVAWSANVEREMVITEAARFYEELATGPIMVPISTSGFATQLEQRVGKARAGQKALEKAGDIGSQAHQMIEWTLRASMCQDAGPAPQIGPEARIAYAAWMDWKDSVRLKPISVESVVYSHKYQYAGTMDYLCAEINGVETLCDWKTGKRVYYEAHLQNAAYRVAIREMGIADPQAGLILRLPKNDKEPGFEAVPAWDEQECFEAFLAARKLWESLQKHDEWLKRKDDEEIEHSPEETITNEAMEAANKKPVESGAKQD